VDGGRAALGVPRKEGGYTGPDTLNVGQQTVSGRLAILLIGSNGLALDPQGRLVITAMADRTVVRLEKDGKRILLADRYEGKRLSGPNDVVVKSDGAVYFTDSVNGLRGGASGPLRELPFNGVYRVKDGESVFGQRRGTGRSLDHVAGGQASGHAATAADSGRASAADLRD
jgi:gluconolactonase